MDTTSCHETRHEARHHRDPLSRPYLLLAYARDIAHDDFFARSCHFRNLRMQWIAVVVFLRCDAGHDHLCGRRFKWHVGFALHFVHLNLLRAKPATLETNHYDS